MKSYVIYNECMADFLAMYCEGKSNIWNAFFGFKLWTCKGGEVDKWCYKVPSSIYQLAEEYAHKWDEYEVI